MASNAVVFQEKDIKKLIRARDSMNELIAEFAPAPPAAGRPAPKPKAAKPKTRKPTGAAAHKKNLQKKMDAAHAVAQTLPVATEPEPVAAAS